MQAAGMAAACSQQQQLQHGTSTLRQGARSAPKLAHRTPEFIPGAATSQWCVIRVGSSSNDCCVGAWHRRPLAGRESRGKKHRSQQLSTTVWHTTDAQQTALHHIQDGWHCPPLTHPLVIISILAIYSRPLTHAPVTARASSPGLPGTAAMWRGHLLAAGSAGLPAAKSSTRCSKGAAMLERGTGAV